MATKAASFPAAGGSRAEFEEALSAAARNIGIMAPPVCGRAEKLSGPPSHDPPAVCLQWSILTRAIRNLSSSSPAASVAILGEIIERQSVNGRRLDFDIVAGCKSRLEILARAYLHMLHSPAAANAGHRNSMRP